LAASYEPHSAPALAPSPRELPDLVVSIRQETPSHLHPYSPMVLASASVLGNGNRRRGPGLLRYLPIQPGDLGKRRRVGDHSPLSRPRTDRRDRGRSTERGSTSGDGGGTRHAGIAACLPLPENQRPKRQDGPCPRSGKTMKQSWSTC
jgi:hypothetical protein